jgi:ABC-type multidrug transport system fused ATPase/permease subunit
MGLYASVATARVSLGRVREILDARIDVVEKPDAEALGNVRGQVAFENVSIAFRPDRDALADVSFTVDAGETVVIVGPSGGGKSTLADLVVRLLDPKAGRVLIDGKDLRDLRLHDLRSHVVLVDQDPFIFHATVGDNVRYAKPDASDAQVVEAIRAAGALEFVESLPHGVDTSIGERGKALSAGERQRIAIARAFLVDPAILILDEATASLDPESERDVVAGYEALMRGRTTILITHRFDLARRANRALVLEAGRVVEEGDPATLLQRRGRFREMFADATPAS